MNLVNAAIGFVVYWTCLAYFTLTDRASTAWAGARNDYRHIRTQLTRDNLKAWLKPNPLRDDGYYGAHHRSRRSRRLRAATAGQKHLAVVERHRGDFDLAGGE